MSIIYRAEKEDFELYKRNQNRRKGVRVFDDLGNRWSRTTAAIGMLGLCGVAICPPVGLFLTCVGIGTAGLAGVSLAGKKHLENILANGEDPRGPNAPKPQYELAEANTDNTYTPLDETVVKEPTMMIRK